MLHLSIWKARKSSVCRYIQSTTSAPLSMPDGIYIYIFLYIFLSSSLSLSSSCLHHCHCHFLVFIIVIPRKICFPPSDESPGAELNEQESIVILRYFICWLWWKMLKNKERLLFLSHILGIHKTPEMNLKIFVSKNGLKWIEFKAEYNPA